MTTFAKESDFEAAVIHELRQRGWGDADVIKHPSEADLPPAARKKRQAAGSAT